MAKRAVRKNKGGRPKKGDEPLGEKFGIRLPPVLRGRLQEWADDSGVTLSDEIRQRLEYSLGSPKPQLNENRDASSFGLLETYLADRVLEACGVSWLTSPFARRALEHARDVALDHIGEYVERRTGQPQTFRIPAALNQEIRVFLDAANLTSDKPEAIELAANFVGSRVGNDLGMRIKDMLRTGGSAVNGGEAVQVLARHMKEAIEAAANAKDEPTPDENPAIAERWKK